jgi:hypothetical protein
MGDLDPLDGHQRLQLGLRPARAAVFVSKGAGWRNVARRLLEAFSRTWGGAGLIAIPTDGSDIHPVFWKVLRAFDPDYLCAFADTLRALQMRAPADFEKWLDDQAILWTSSNGGTVDEAKALLLNHTDMNAPTSAHWIPGPPLATSLPLNVSAYQMGTHLIAHEFTADSKAPHPLVDMTEITEPAITLIRELDVSAFGEDVQLLFDAATGRLSPAYRSHLKARVPVEIVALDPDHLEPAMGLYLRGAVDAGDWGMHKATMQVIGTPVHEDPSWTAPTYLEASPLASTRTGLARMVYAGPELYAYPRRVYLIVGETAEDFWLAYSLNRLMGASFWLPAQLVGDAPAEVDAVTRSFADFTRDLLQGGDTEVLVTSLSVPPAELTVIRNKLLAAMTGGLHAPGALKVIGAEQIAVPFAYRFLDARHLGEVRHEAFVRGEMAGTLSPLTPAQVRGATPDSVTWLIDVSVGSYRLAARAALNPLVAAPDVDSEHVRSGSEATYIPVAHAGLCCRRHST